MTAYFFLCKYSLCILARSFPSQNGSETMIKNVEKTTAKMECVSFENKDFVFRVEVVRSVHRISAMKEGRSYNRTERENCSTLYMLILLID